MRAAGFISIFLCAACAIGCGSPGAVTFDIHSPSEPLLDPFSDPRVSELLIKTASGTLLGAASPRDDGAPLPLGPLAASAAPEDLVLSVLGGSDLLGMARVRDVEIRPATRVHYPAEVRKPFFFVGSALPDESDAQNQPAAAEVLDPTDGLDLASALAAASPPVMLPDPVGAAAVSSDGRFLFAGHPAATAFALTVVDTGTGQPIGDAPLDGAPGKIVTAARDVAAAVLLPDAGAALLFPDVAALTTNPASAQPIRATLRDAPRAAAFSPDGQRLYVLLGQPHDLDPCGEKTAPLANSIEVIGSGGQSLSVLPLPAFGADLTVDPATGRLIVSLPLSGKVLSLDPNDPTSAPMVLLDGESCPSALAISAGDLFVVTADVAADANSGAPSWSVRRLPASGGPATALPFPQPVYEGAVNESQPRDGMIGFDLKVRPKFVYAYELAVAPDASRLVFATRAHYRETSDQSFDLIAGFTCQPTVDIVEYGRYSLDTRTGSASYQSRSQLVTSPAAGQPCVACSNAFFDISFTCPSSPGDRPAGLAAVFGSP